MPKLPSITSDQIIKALQKTEIIANNSNVSKSKKKA